MNNQNHTQDFFATIALEAQALEDTFSREYHNLHTSATLLGKPWYGVGLESNDNDQEKDNANKIGIVKRMVDAIVGFIKRMVERIKKFFAWFTKDKVQKNAEFVKNYGGPSDEQLIATVKKLTKEAAGDKTVATESIAALERLPAEHGGELNKWLEEYLSVTGKSINRQQAGLAYKKDKLDAMVQTMSEESVVLIGSMLESEFAEDFKQGSEFAQKVVGRPFHPDNLEDYLKFSNQVVEYNGKCQEVIKFMTSQSAEKRTHVLGEWILFGDKKAVHCMEIYAESGASFEFAATFMEKLAEYVWRLGTMDSELAVQKLKIAQKILSNMTAFVSLSTRVAVGYDRIVRGARDL